jgi:O-antigen/teichoic acid export membrane protein
MDLISIGIMLFSGYKDSLVKAYDEKGFEKVTYWYTISFWTLFLIILIVELFYYTHFFKNKLFSSYALVCIFFSNSLMIFFSYYNASHKIYKVMLFENVVMAFALVFFFGILHLVIHSAIDALFISFVFSYAVRSLYILIVSPIKFNVKKSKFGEAKLFFKNNVLSSLMYFFSGLFISASSLMLLKLFNDTNFLSEFQVVIKSLFFSLVAIFVFPLNTFTFPQISKLATQKSFVEIKRLEKKLFYYLVALFVLLIIATFLTPFAIGLIFPVQYHGSYAMLNLLLPTLPFIAYTTFALNILKGFNRFDLALYVRIFGTFLFFSSIYLFYILGFDAKSLIYSLDISFLGMFALACYYRSRLFR